MIVYFANRQMQIQGQASTSLPKGFKIIEDLKTEEIETGVATFSCRIAFDDDTRTTLEKMTNAGNYLLRSNGSENEFYTIIDTEVDTKNRDIYIYAEDAGLDLINEIVGDFEADDSYSAEWYINKYITDSGFEIGLNEIPATSKRKLSWSGEATVTARLASIATQFGGYEISYSYAIKGLEITHKYVNIHEKRGKDNGVTLHLNRDIDKIVTTKSVANLATAFLCEGGVPDNAETPVTFSSTGYKYDDGDFYISGNLLISRKASEKWKRPGANNGYIVRPYSYDTTDPETLKNHAMTELKKVCDMEINYEVNIKRLPEGVKIGDRINIVDDAGEMYVSSRILLLEVSIVDRKHKLTLGENLIKTSGISQRVEEMAAQFANTSQSAAQALTVANNAATNAEAAKASAEAAYSMATSSESNSSSAHKEAQAARRDSDSATTKANEALAAAEAAQAAADKAQEDVDSLAVRVTTAETTIEQHAEKIALRATRTEVVNLLANYSTREETEAAIELKADAITSSVSSTYATKTELNTTNAKIGEGGNLLINGAPSNSENWGLNHGVTFNDGYFSVPAFTPATEGSHGDTISQGFANRIPFASYERRFKIRFDARDTSGGNKTGHIAIWLRWKAADGSQNWPAFDLELSKLTDSWVSYSGTITIPAERKVDAFGIGLYTTSAFDIRSLYLEEVTDLLETNAEIASVQENVDATNERVTSAESLIQQLSNCIEMLVTDENGESLMTQTENGWTFSMKETAEAISRLMYDLEYVGKEAGDAKTTVDILRQAVNDHGATLKYVNITTYEDEPCIELGESDSDFKLLITNTRIMFMNAGNVPTYINTNGLVTQDIEVKGEIVQGGFVMLNTSEGGWGLLWKGVSN